MIKAGVPAVRIDRAVDIDPVRGLNANEPAAVPSHIPRVPGGSAAAGVGWIGETAIGNAAAADAVPGDLVAAIGRTISAVSASAAGIAGVGRGCAAAARPLAGSPLAGRRVVGPRLPAGIAERLRIEARIGGNPHVADSEVERPAVCSVRVRIDPAAGPGYDVVGDGNQAAVGGPARIGHARVDVKRRAVGQDEVGAAVDHASAQVHASAV